MITIRNYQESDAPALWPVFYSAIREVCIANYPPELIQAWAPDNISPARWAARMTGIQPFIAQHDGAGEILGYADLQDDGYIDHFFVSARAQRIGVASSLMRHILASARERNIPLLYSRVSLNAQGLYMRFGFQIVQQELVNLGTQSLPVAKMELRREL